MPKNTSPELFHWYANYKKKQLGGANQGGDLGTRTTAEAEELQEKLMLMQRHYVIVEKKEEYAKQTLIDSQSKWTLFSKDVLNIAKELL